MIGLTFMRLINSHCWIAAGFSEVRDVTEYVALSVLRAGTADVSAESEKGDCRLSFRPGPNRQTPQ